jgi:hypothetical protein
MNQQTGKFTVILLCSKFEQWTIDFVSSLPFITDFVPLTVQNDLFRAKRYSQFTQFPVMKGFHDSGKYIFRGHHVVL